MLGPLADPTAHGGAAADAFHVVCPSLPGYGFSDKPAATGWGVERIAAAWAELMAPARLRPLRRAGSDWGTSVSTVLAREHPERVAGIHLSRRSPRRTPRRSATLTERRARRAGRPRAQRGMGLGLLGASTRRGRRRSATALVDSPVALAAWIVEKFRAWTDCDGHPENAVARDVLLDNLMLYWLPRAGASSARLYWESMRTVNEWISGTVGDTIGVPTGCSIFPRELQRPSRRWAERRFTDIVHWNELDRGGHFAALEQPELFVGELRASLARVRAR